MIGDQHLPARFGCVGEERSRSYRGVAEEEDPRGSRGVAGKGGSPKGQIRDTRHLVCSNPRALLLEEVAGGEGSPRMGCCRREQGSSSEREGCCREEMGRRRCRWTSDLVAQKTCRSDNFGYRDCWFEVMP
ncbi:hypothetical protein MLD38_037026 [Melastoma candidum]|uniref:Uncharacterized protein n=1 Tax=Melastoma candidum TaxID=119954 RepID=A0ACB9LLQ1_9MYRT|nr:hypothetical protein MLD38_037026 [Melastoma candidum]